MLDIDQLIAKIEENFKNNIAIDITRDNLRIHIDRQLPYLAIYRRTSSETEAITNVLRTLSSYIELPLGDEYQEFNQDLLCSIVELHFKFFGNSLIFDISSTKSPREAIEKNKPVPPQFNIISPENNKFHDVLDTLESALLNIKIRKQQAIVNVSFKKAIPIVKDLEEFDLNQAQTNIATYGLEIEEIYQDSDGKEIYPYALKSLQRGLDLAIKKTVFTFSHKHTQFHPKHFHVIGRHTLMNKVQECDKALAKISESFDLLLHVTPINANDAWERFKNNNFNTIPEFHYRPRTVDPALLKRALYQIPLEEIDDPALNYFFTSKRAELDEQIGLLGKRELPSFLHSSVQVFGVIDDDLKNTALQIINHKTDLANQADNSAFLDASQLAIEAKSLIDYYKNIDNSLKSSVQVRDDVTGILVSHGHFLIGKDAHVSETRLNATLAHEIGTHVLTYHNGKHQPFNQLYSGMAGYEELQEGLAVFAEYMSGGLDHARLLVLAGRVLAVDSAIKGADFIETFRYLSKDLGFQDYTAYIITMRVYRGGGYTKDMIYLRGLLKLLKLIAKMDEFSILFAGKIAFEHITLMEELNWRNITKPPALLPRYFQDEVALKKIDAIKTNPSIEALL